MIRRSSKQTPPRSSTGFSLVELVIVVAIALIVMAIAIPGIRRSLQFYSLRSGITSVTGAIQSTRYQAIFHGCRYQIVFSAAAYSYTVANQVPAAGNSTCTGVYGAPGRCDSYHGSRRRAGCDDNHAVLPEWDDRYRARYSPDDFEPYLYRIQFSDRDHYGVYLWKNQCHSISSAAKAASPLSKRWSLFSYSLSVCSASRP